MNRIKPIYVFILLMVIGVFLSIGSYELGKRAGTRELVQQGSNGMTNYSWQTDEEKIMAYTETYRGIGYMVLLIGGIGLVAMMIKNE